jgi:hypothetical protein
MRAAGVWICGALAVLAVCLSATPAAATPGVEPGVHVDPGSPAEKEYVLPLNQARQTGGGRSSGRSSTAPLFGAGVTPPRGGGGSTAGSGSSPSSSAGARTPAARRGAASGKGVPRPAPLPSVVLRTTRSQGSSGGSGSLLALLGGGLAILLLGGFGGTVLRHNRRPTPSS